MNELRKLGVNAIRTAHNPPSPEFLDLTDRMGFLVMDELFDQWTGAKNPFDYHKDFNEWSKIDVADTVRRDRNHPSVFIYSAGNEIRDNHADQEKAKRTLRGLVDAFHENDPTRPVTQALFGQISKELTITTTVSLTLSMSSGKTIAKRKFSPRTNKSLLARSSAQRTTDRV